MSIETSLAWLDNLSAPGGWQSSSAYLPALVLFFVFVVVLSLPLLARFVYWTLIYPYHTSPLRHLPGPKDDVYLLGQTHKFFSIPWLPQLFLEWCGDHPDSPFIRYLGVGNSEILIATSITAYKEVLQAKNSYFVKPDLTRRTAAIVVGEGLPFAEGHSHRQRRAALTKPFSVPRLKRFVPVLRAKAHRLAHVLSRNRDSQGEVEAESHIWKTVLDVIGVETLGVDFDHLESDASPLHSLFSKTMQQSPVSHIIHYFNSYLPLRNLVPIRANSEFLRNCAEIRGYIREHVMARRLAWQSNKDSPHGDPDALQCMIDTGSSLWDDEEIVEYVLNLLVLGHDTTACSLVWAIYALARFPDVQERLRTEVRGLMQTDKEPSYGDMERLPFLDNFMREVLRMYCPVAFIPREATCDVEIAGELLPRGTVVYLSPAVMNLNPSIWGPDAGEFDPSRWDDLKAEAASVYAFESFHHGAHMCLGKQLSLVEMKVMLMELVTRFRIESLDEGRPLELARPSFTLRPKEKLRVRLVDI